MAVAADLPFDLPEGLDVWFVPPPTTVRAGRIEGVRPGPKGPLVKISGVDTIDAAHALCGTQMLAQRADIPDEWFEGAEEEFDADGMTVRDEEHGLLGEVVETIVTGANDVWVVEGPFGQVLLAGHRRRRARDRRGEGRDPRQAAAGAHAGRGGDRVIVDVITIFPGMFEGPMSASIVGLARERGHLEFRAHDLRDWTHDKHRSTDDTPYGGGPGLVMKPEPIFEAVEAVQALEDDPGYVVFFTPAGRPFTQELAEELAEHDRLVMVCGRYEGFDERVLSLADLELSIGDYVLTGGELPAMVVIDAVSRHIPGVLGDEESAADESFSEGLLEYPQYTRPAEYRGMSVPEVLRSGDHGKIAAWRREQSVRKTALVRPDLLAHASLSDDERTLAAAHR